MIVCDCCLCMGCLMVRHMDFREQPPRLPPPLLSWNSDFFEVPLHGSVVCAVNCLWRCSAAAVDLATLVCLPLAYTNVDQMMWHCWHVVATLLTLFYSVGRRSCSSNAIQQPLGNFSVAAICCCCCWLNRIAKGTQSIGRIRVRCTFIKFDHTKFTFFLFYWQTANQTCLFVYFLFLKINCYTLKCKIKIHSYVQDHSIHLVGTILSHNFHLAFGDWFIFIESSNRKNERT